jgi:hypothetical protein
MPRIPVLAAVAALVLLVLAPGAARAWDPEGDRVVALLAYERLTPEVRAKVDGLLADRPEVAGCDAGRLDDAVTFAACLKGKREDVMRDIAYDALPLCGPPPPSRCADGRCATAALARYLAELKTPATPRPERVRALMAVTYLMAEIHQPLHAADNADHNGDRLRVVLPGAMKARTSLYTVWDNDVVSGAIGGVAETGLPYVRALADAHGDAWSRGAIADWLADSHDVALHVAYGRLPHPPACNKLPDGFEGLGPDYFAAAVPAAREQLAKAGVRLAVVLNAALG